jgi:hypothetical protein
MLYISQVLELYEAERMVDNSGMSALKSAGWVISTSWIDN